MTSGHDARWARLDGVVDHETIRNKHVLVAGLGSGGSTVALELAKAGVGRFTLIDPDRVEDANLIRHECDDRYLGWNKAEAVADLIRHRNPGAEIEVVAADIFSMSSLVTGLIPSVDLVAACTDVEPPKNHLNRLCMSAGVPAVYAGVYERATGGEVIRCLAGIDHACYACVTSVLKEDLTQPSPQAVDYGLVDEGGTRRAVSGLGLDVRLVAMIHAKVCLLTLLGDQLPGNVVLFGNTRVEGLFPRAFASAFMQISPQEGCLVCEPIRTGALSSRMSAVTGQKCDEKHF